MAVLGRPEATNPVASMAGPTDAVQRGRRSTARVAAGKTIRSIGRVWRGVLRKSSRTVLVLYALALGAFGGLVSANYATRGAYRFGGFAIGAWTAWPQVGSVSADPYARAINARRGEIPLAVGEGMMLTASKDDEGRTLSAACAYTIGGGVPPARAWTLTVTGRGTPVGEPAVLREGFTSTEILREPSGRFAIVLSPDARPGNWLPMPRPTGPVRLALRLYDTPVAASIGSLDRENVPAITRLSCNA